MASMAKQKSKNGASSSNSRSESLKRDTEAALHIDNRGSGIRANLERVLERSRSLLITSRGTIVNTMLLSSIGVFISLMKLLNLGESTQDTVIPITLMVLASICYGTYKCIYKENLGVYKETVLNRKPRTAIIHPRYNCAKKGFGLVMTVAFFAFLDSYLKGSDVLWSTVLCSSVFTLLVVLMTVFNYSEDFDLANAFLFAAYGFFLQVFEILWAQVFLTLVIAVLCAIKTVLIEGASLGAGYVSMAKQKSKNGASSRNSGASSSNGRSQSLTRDIEAALDIDHRGSGIRAILDRVLESSRSLLLGSRCTILSIMILSSTGVFLSMMALLDLEELELRSVIPITLMVLIIVCSRTYTYALKHNIGNRKPWTGRIHPNYYCAKKGLGLVMTVAFFAYTDSYLKGSDVFWSAVLCSSIFTMLVLLMAVFDYSEDFDLANAFLFASYGLFLQVFEILWEKIILTLVIAVLCAFKTVIIEGASLGTGY